MPLEYLLDIDPLRLVLGRLRNDYRKDAVGEFGFDGILIDARWEGEGAVELPNRALGYPVLWSVVGRCAAGLLRGLTAAGFLGDLDAAGVIVLRLCFVGFVVRILDRDFVAAGIAFGDVSRNAALSLVGTIGRVLALDVAFDD